MGSHNPPALVGVRVCPCARDLTWLQPHSLFVRSIITIIHPQTTRQIFYIYKAPFLHFTIKSHSLKLITTKYQNNTNIKYNIKMKHNFTHKLRNLQLWSWMAPVNYKHVYWGTISLTLSQIYFYRHYCYFVTSLLLPLNSLWNY